LETSYTHAQLAERVKYPGWETVKDENSSPISGTLEDVLKVTHERHKDGHTTERIKEIATAIELDMIEIEMLWRYLGLPV
jgi:hypothetical protein